MFGWNWPLAVRRLLGLCAFFTVSLHFLTYLVLDQFFDFAAIVDDVVKRKFITVGFLAFVLLIPLAVTSTNGMVKRLGFPRWKRLHRLTYVADRAGRRAFHLAGQGRPGPAADLRRRCWPCCWGCAWWSGGRREREGDAPRGREWPVLASCKMARAMAMPSSVLPTPVPSNTPLASQLGQLAAEYWDGRLRADPIEATLLGDHRFDDQLPDPSPAANASRARPAGDAGAAGAGGGAGRAEPG